MIYRPDIDGLRAVAVIPVVLFHAGLAGLGGGFTGVDVFFVISGYLIAKLIAGEIAREKFSILTFYERRARRILPALFAMMAVSSVVAAIYFLPGEFRDFGKSVVATTLFASNFLFWSETGYFDAPVELKPLLHTWSLAVEEQFYIAFPALMVLCHRFGRGRWGLWLVPLFAGSFALSVWGAVERPDATFFLAPGRAWELLLGALLAVGVIPGCRSRALGEAAGIAGLALIAYGMVMLSKHVTFPGLNALYPCLGAALVVWSGEKDNTLAARLLAAKPLVAVGLISYSLYLWHWPALVFTRYILMRDLVASELALLLAAVLAVSYLSWRYVEMPVRTGSTWRGLRLFKLAAGASLASLAFGSAVVASRGFPARTAPEALRILAEAEAAPKLAKERKAHERCSFIDEARAYGRLCLKGAHAGKSASFVLVGDSHAGALSDGVFEAAERLGLAGYQFTGAGFRPLPGVVDVGTPWRADLTPRFIDFLKRQPDLKLVILVGFWELQATGRSYRHSDVLFSDSQYDGTGLAYNRQSFARGLKALIETFPDRQFALIEDVPSGWRLDAQFAARIAHINGGIPLESRLFGISRAAYESQIATYRDILASAAGGGNAFVVPIGDVLCDREFCHGYRDGHLLYFNGDHLSQTGARQFRDKLSEVLRRGLDAARNGTASAPTEPGAERIE